MAADGIFISYRREESAGFAGRLYDRLVSRFGHERVFMDVEGIDPGSDFVEAIEGAVASCRALIVVIGPRWATLEGRGGKRRLEDPQDFVRLETAAALKRGIRVLPVLVDDAEMPEEEQLPPDLLPLLRRQAIEINHKHWEASTADLLKALSKILDNGEQADQEDSTGTSRFPLRRALWFGGTTTFAAIAAAIVWTLTAPDEPPPHALPDTPLRDSPTLLSAAAPPATAPSASEIGAESETDTPSATIPPSPDNGSESESASAATNGTRQDEAPTIPQDPDNQSAPDDVRSSTVQPHAAAEAATPTPTPTPTPAPDATRARDRPATSDTTPTRPPPARTPSTDASAGGRSSSSATAPTPRTPPTPTTGTGTDPAQGAVGTRQPQSGESWTYSVRGLWATNRDRTHIYTIEAASEGRVRERLQVRTSAGSRELTTISWQSRGEEVAQRSGTLPEFSPYLAAFDGVGEGSRWRSVPTPPYDQRWDGWNTSGRVTGMESVTVPAGTYRAWKADIWSNRHATGGPTLAGLEPVSVHYEIWYAPSEKRFVKKVRTVKAAAGANLERDTFELVSVGRAR